MIISNYTPDGTLESVDLDYGLASSTQRGKLMRWCEVHDLDPKRVPAVVTVDYDTATREWIVPVYVTGPDGKLLMTDDRSDIRRRTVRRRAKEMPDGRPL